MSPTNYQLTQKIYNSGMKYIKQTIVPLLLLISFLPLIEANATSLDAEIAKIKSAPPHLRVKLMNQLKIKIWKMRQAQRLRAIKRLRSSISSSAKRVVVHTTKQSKLNKHHNISDKQIISINPLRERINTTNYHTVNIMIHNVRDTYRIVKKHSNKNTNITVKKNHSTTDISQNRDSINTDKIQDNKIDNKPLDILDTKPSTAHQDKVVTIEHKQQSDTIDKTVEIDISTKTNPNVITDNKAKSSIKSTQDIDSNGVQIDSSTTIDTKITNDTQSYKDTKTVTTKQNNINSQQNSIKEPIKTNEDTHITNQLNNSIKVNKDTHQSNNIETHENIQTDNNIKIHEDTHIQEHNRNNLSNTHNTQISTSQNHPNMRSLLRVNILNRSRRR